MTTCRSVIIISAGLALVLALFLQACSPRSGAKAPGYASKENYYFDAELAFALEYPSDWKLVRGAGLSPESCTVRWKSSSTPDVRAEVVACPSPGRTEEFGAMRGEFLARHPALTVTREETVELPAGRGHLIEGYGAARAHLAVLMDTEARKYSISFSAPRADFERFRPLFEKILASFRPLGDR